MKAFVARVKCKVVIVYSKGTYTTRKISYLYTTTAVHYVSLLVRCYLLPILVLSAGVETPSHRACNTITPVV